jgi:DNA-binding CsgD family transcriptional regulator
VQPIQPIDIAKGIWKTHSSVQIHTSEEKARLAIELSNRLVHFFQPGDFYYYLFNVSTLQFDFISPGIEKVLGYTPEEITLDLLFSLFHPEDQRYYVNYENEVGKFLQSLGPERIFKYKIRMDLRMRRKDGSYTRILYQTMAFDLNDNGQIVRAFGVHTDIGFLNIEGTPTLSFIGFDGEPSYTNVQASEVLIPIRESPLSRREKEILNLVMEGLLNKEIAGRLNIAKETVDKHRKNMLDKTDCKTSTELVAKAIKNGWV